MNVLNRFLAEVSEATASELTDACSSWVHWALSRATEPLPGSATDPNDLPERCRPAFQDAVADLGERLKIAAGAVTRGHERRGPPGAVLQTLTSCFLRGDEEEVGRYNGFKSFVVALACYHLLRCTEDPGEREQAAECLLLALSVPVEGVSRAITAARLTAPADDEVLDRVAKSVVNRWVEETPDDFGKALAAARQRGVWGTQDILRDRGRLLRAVEVKRVLKDDFERSRTYARNELLDAIYPVACRVTRATRNDGGRRLFLWLILGGVSHTKKSEERSKEGSDLVQRLVQPALLAALEDRFGKNFVRAYRDQVSREFSAGGSHYWEVARARLLDIFEQDGLNPERRSRLNELLGDSPEAGLARLAGASGALKQRPVRQAAGRGRGAAMTAAPPGGEPARPYLGWELFVEVGRQTFWKIRAGYLGELERFAEQLRHSNDPVALVRHWLRPGAGAPPDRALVAGVAQYLCERTRSLSGWLSYLTEFAEERRDAVQASARRP